MSQRGITKAALEQATVPQGKNKLRVRDGQIIGFILEIRPSGIRTFYFRYRDKRGRTREYKIGRYPNISLQQARQRATELLAQTTLGGDPAVERESLRATPTVETFITDSYLPFVRDRLRSSGDLEAMARLKVIPALGRKALDEVRPHDVQEFRRQLIANGLSNGRVNRYLALLRRLFNLAIEWGLLVGRNPAVKPGMLHERHREVYLTHDQLRALLIALGQDHDLVAAIAIATLALTGARKSEVLKARWENVDASRSQLTVPLSKSGHTRHIPLSSAALALIDRLPRSPDNPFVFPGRKAGTHLIEVRSAWKRAKRAAGVPVEVRLHDLRHTAASTMVNAGIPLQVIGKILGHRQLATTSRYAHLDQQNLLAATSVVADIALGSDAD